MATLLVRLPHADAGEAVSVGHAWADRAAADGAALAFAPAGRLPTHTSFVLLVPPSRLAWHRAVLPPGSGLGRSGAAAERRLLAVVTGALEDRLLQEPAQLHLAIVPAGPAPAGAGAKPDGGDAVWVGVVDRAWLKGWIDGIGGGRQLPERIVPLLAPALDPADGQLHVDDFGDVVSLQVRSARGCLVAAPSPEALAGALANLGVSDDFTLTATPGAAARAEALVQELGLAQRTAQIVSAAQVLALAVAQPWDLAQFEFASRGRVRVWRRLMATLSSLAFAPAWRPARWGVAALLLVQLLGLNAWAWHREQSLRALRVQAQALVSQTFPDVRLVVDPLAQMQRELVALRRSAGAVAEGDLDALLMRVAAAWQRVRPDSALAAGGPRVIEFAGGELRLRGMSLGAADAQALQQQLATADLRVRAEGDTWTVSAPATTGPRP